MTSSDIILLISLAVVVLWTTRLARAKGLNPWMWGVGSVLLIAVAWNFLTPQFLGLVGMTPLFFLLLFRSTLFRRSKATASVPCPRCGAPDTGGLNFCVQCGWDLSRSYADVGGDAGPAVAPVEESLEREPVTPVVDSLPETLPETGPEREQRTVPEPAVAPAETAEPVGTPVGTVEPVLAQEAEPTPPTPPAAVETPRVEPPAPPPRPIPTAANMTERGIMLFSQGRFQEAVDQFTKAIALDPKYRLAWERRAEAYGRLGRAERAAADKQQLEAI